MKSAGATPEDALRLLRAGQARDAAALCEARLRAVPHDAAARQVAAMAALELNAPERALAHCEQGLRAQPRSTLLHLQRALALRALRRDEEALVALRQALQLEPLLAEAHHQLGNALKRLGRWVEAEASLRRAAELQPHDASIWLNLGVTQLELARPGDAIACFRQAVALAPDRPEAHNVLGAALLEQGSVSEGIAAFEAALRLRSGYAAAHNNLARAYRMQARHLESVQEFRAALALGPDPRTHSNYLYSLNFLPLAPEDIFAEHVAWGRRYGAGSPPSLPERAARAPGPLRVGFVSPDLVNHAVAYFFEPLLRRLDRAQFHVTCYSDAPKADAVTQRLRSLAQRWRDTAALPDDGLFARVREDGIDILIDLAGHTGRNRLVVFARRAAPVQMTWLGYPNTTGVPAMDYRITEAVSDPVGKTEGWHTERLLRLPKSFLCYQPPEDAPAVKDCPAASAGFVTFGSFSNLAKLSEACLGVWARVMARVPKSRLALKSRGLADGPTADRIRAVFATAGIAPERVALDGQLVSVGEHLRQYQRVDIALDPFPYNGTTTTCEALWMGTPVVTLAGSAHVSRVGASLLTQIGAPEWIAADLDGYVETAAQLASSLERLAELRGALRERMRGSALCDAAGFAAEFGAALRAAWAERAGRS